MIQLVREEAAQNRIVENEVDSFNSIFLLHEASLPQALAQRVGLLPLTSNDTFHPDMFGGEIAAGFAPRASGVSFYAGAGANRIDPHFQVGFTDGNGNVDRTEVELKSPLVRATVFGGVTAIVRQIFDAGAQIYSVPSDATLFRRMGGVRFR